MGILVSPELSISKAIIAESSILIYLRPLKYNTGNCVRLANLPNLIISNFSTKKKEKKEISQQKSVLV